MRDLKTERIIDTVLLDLVCADAWHGDYTDDDRWDAVEDARLKLKALIDRAFDLPQLGVHIVDPKLQYQLDAKRKRLYLIFGIKEVDESK